MKKKLFISVAVVLIIAAICFLFLQNKNKLVETTGYEVKNSNYKDVISSIGTVEYNSQLEVKAEVSGILLEVNKEIGDKINAGDLIAKIDNKQALIDNKETINKSLLAKAKYEDYMNAYNQNTEAIKDQRLLQEKEIIALKLEQSQLNAKILVATKLLSEGAVPANDLENLNEQMALLALNIETANTKLDTFRLPSLSVQEIKTSIDAANESINKQKIELLKYSVQAPIEGIVIDKKLQAGTYVQAGEVLLRIASDKEKYAVVEIDEKYISKVSMGKEAQIFMEAYPDEIIKGTVVKVSPEVNKDTGTIGVKVKILEKPELFLQNMAVKVEFVGESFNNSVVIPGEYLVKGEDSAVYMEDENGLVVKKKIVVYNKNVNNIRVLEGLEAGVTILNPENLEEGLRVKVNNSLESESGL